MKLFVVFLLLSVMVAAQPGSALACKCPHPSLSSAVKKADAVFIGEVTVP